MCCWGILCRFTLQKRENLNFLRFLLLRAFLTTCSPPPAFGISSGSVGIRKDISSICSENNCMYDTCPTQWILRRSGISSLTAFLYTNLFTSYAKHFWIHPIWFLWSGRYFLLKWPIDLHLLSDYTWRRFKLLQSLGWLRRLTNFLLELDIFQGSIWHRLGLF